MSADLKRLTTDDLLRRLVESSESERRETHDAFSDIRTRLALIEADTKRFSSDVPARVQANEQGISKLENRITVLEQKLSALQDRIMIYVGIASASAGVLVAIGMTFFKASVQ